MATILQTSVVCHSCGHRAAPFEEARPAPVSRKNSSLHVLIPTEVPESISQTGTIRPTRDAFERAPSIADNASMTPLTGDLGKKESLWRKARIYVTHGLSLSRPG